MATSTTTYGHYIDRIKKDSPYRVILENFSGNTRAGATIVHGWLTQPIQIRVASTYDALTEQRGSSVINFITQGVLNKSTVMQSFTHQVWRGVEVPEFTVNFTYIATRTAKGDVVEPIKNLLTWVVPPRNGNPLIPPARANQACTMTIGNWLHIRDLLPVSVDANFAEIYDTVSNSPIKGEVTFSFIYSHAPTAEDVMSWFKL